MMLILTTYMILRNYPPSQLHGLLRQGKHGHKLKHFADTQSSARSQEKFAPLSRVSVMHLMFFNAWKTYRYYYYLYLKRQVCVDKGARGRRHAPQYLGNVKNVGRAARTLACVGEF